MDVLVLQPNQLSPIWSLGSVLFRKVCTMTSIPWRDHAIAAHRLLQSMTMGNFDNDYYNPNEAIAALLCTLIAFTFALYILAYPPKHRKLSVFALTLPTAYAFWRHPVIAPSRVVCDTFGRFLYIWLAHMSYVVAILEYTPAVEKEHDGCKPRLQAAYKILFCRRQPPETHKSRPAPKHTHSRSHFLRHHAWKATHLCLAQHLWYVLITFYMPLHNPIHGPSHSTQPMWVITEHIWTRFATLFHWCIINMFLYEAYHSVFALVFVGVLRLDGPDEWDLALFRPVTEAWSMRRYWGVHWHNYIAESFCEHAKVLTRAWLGMQRGSMATRLVENTLVFGASGLMHSLVRYVQDGEWADYWAIAIWYVGQMVPIVLEGWVQVLWRRLKRKVGITDGKWLGRLERAVGYVWVTGFMLWSVNKYVRTRDAWSLAGMRKKFQRELAEYEKMQGIEIL